MSLFHLHTCILSPVLSDWVDIHDLTKLDTAACNHENRSNLLGLIASDAFVHDTTRLNTDKFYFEWLLARSVKIKNISLEKFKNVKKGPSAQKVLKAMKTIRHLVTHGSLEQVDSLIGVGDHVQSVEILPMDNAENNENLSNILDTFQNLTSLKIRGNFTFCNAIENTTPEKLVANLTSLDMRNSDESSEGFLDLMHTDGGNLTDLRVSNEEWDVPYVKKLISTCPMLTMFEAWHSDFLDEALICLLKSSLQLKHISLNAAITDSNLAEAFEQCKDLETVTLSFMGGVDDEVLVALTKSCGLTGFKKLALDGNKLFSNEALTTLLEKCPFLESLSLSYCSQLTDKTLFAIARNCKLIRSLDISFCPLMSDFGILYIMRECQAVNTNFRFDTSGVTDTVFIAGSQDAQVLHVVMEIESPSGSIMEIQGKNGLSGVKLLSGNIKLKPQSFENIALLNPLLVELEVTAYSELTCASVCGMIAHCPHLKHVSITGSGVMLSSRIVDTLTEHCDGLVTIVLQRLILPIDEGRAHIIQLLLKHAQTLRKFHLLKTNGLTGNVINDVAYKCPQLTSFGFTYIVDTVDDTLIENLVASCFELRVLNLAGSTGLSDDIFYTLSSHALNLRELNIYGCDNLSMASQMEFLCHSPGVTELVCSDGTVVDNNY